MARSLHKEYDRHPVVKDLNLAIRPGEVYGLLGPNGSGKSTTIRMLTGILEPTKGTVSVCGHDMKRSPEMAKASLGYVPDEPVLYEKLTALEFLDFVGELYSLPKAVRRAAMREMLHLLDLEDRSGDRIESYSRGMKQKVAISAALLHNPQVLIMDEPITGLDPITVRVLKGMLRKMARSGAAILLSTHILEVAERLCDRIGILVDGFLVAEGTMAELSAKAPEMSVGGTTLEDIFVGLAAGEEHKDIIDSLEADEREASIASPRGGGPANQERNVGA
ncbi:MAG: ABC transporter ATP-binding protein [Firmicutes bacterium]|nr:ABC transporter ATP-binding protein [Candidatus Fermentithermobacillaceae bacterium]